MKERIIEEMKIQGNGNSFLLEDWDFRLEKEKAIFTSPTEIGGGFYSGWRRQEIYQKKNGKWKLIEKKNV